MRVKRAIADQLRSVRATARRIAPYLRGHWPLVALGCVALFVEIVMRLAEPWPLKVVFDYLLPHASGRPRADLWGLDQWLARQPKGAVVAASAGAVVVLTLARAAAAYASTMAFAVVGNRVLTAVRIDLFRHLQRLSLRFHAQSRTGDLITRLTGDVGRLQEVAVTAVAPLIVHSLTLVGMVALMFTIHWELGLLALAVFPIMWLSTGRLSRRLRDAARAQRQREGEVSAAAAEAISSIRLVQALGIEDQQARVFAKSNSGSLKETVRSARLSARLERSVDILIGVGTALVLWRAASLVLQARLSPGDLVVFLAYLKNAFKPVRDMAKYTGRVAKAAASGERVFEVLDRTPDVMESPQATDAPTSIDELRFDRVGFSYDAKHDTLADLSFSVERGEMIALVGPSGAGKSTIAALILRLFDPARGRVLANGRDIREFALRSWRDRVAPVLQESALFGVSLRENLLHGNPRATEPDMIAACRLVGAWEFVQRLPQGLDTIIGERGDTLSGGQRRRLNLARAAIRSSPILLLDEPTTGLDNENRRLVADAIERLAHGRLTILITHDLLAASSADAIVYLADGRVIERGTHESLMALAGRYAAMYQLQAMDARPTPEPDHAGAR